MSAISRRDFLGVASLAAANLVTSGIQTGWKRAGQDQLDGAPGFLIIVFDAMSASQLSLYGYPRLTTPNIERFADRSTVYHSHYSPGSFTTPGTASLLTGSHPWTHRAVDLAGLVDRGVTEQSLFGALGSDYFRLGYSQNMWADYLLLQFDDEIDKILSPAAFSLQASQPAEWMRQRPSAQRAYTDFLLGDGAPPGSLLFGLAERLKLRPVVDQALSENRPLGLPQTQNYPIFFRLREIFDGLMATIDVLPRPAAAYLHLWAPHEPYRPGAEYRGLFDDDWAPTPKPAHELTDPNFRRTQDRLNRARRRCDQYIAEVDAEFGRLIEMLRMRGVLDRDYVIITSDHGHFIERGVDSHLTPLLYDPGVRIPLVISAPGQNTRLDVTTPTSSVDLLPTMAHLAGREPPPLSEGSLLPSLGGLADPDRSVYMMDLKDNRIRQPLTVGSHALRKGAHKLIYYHGYPQYGGEDKFEFYDIQSDPEELRQLDPADSGAGRRMQEELLNQVFSHTSSD